MKLKRADIADVMKSGARLEEERSRDVVLQVVVEVDAPDMLVDGIREQLRPQTAKARMVIGVVGAGEPIVLDSGSDALVVAVGGGGPDVRALLAAARESFVPALALAVAPVDEHAQRAQALEHPAADVLVDEDVERLLDSRLAGWLADEISSKRLALAHNFPFMRRAVAEAAVRATAWQNALIGSVAILPGADMPVMTANQVKMLLQIAAAYGEPLGPDRIRELLVVVGGGFLFRGVARQALSFVPVLGWAVKGGVGYAGTVAMGKAAIAYFEQGADLQAAAERLRSSLLRRSAGE